MGFFDTFKGNQYKAELEQLQREHESLKALMTPEMRDAFMLKQEIARLQSEQTDLQKQIDGLNLTITSKNSDINALDNEIQQKKLYGWTMKSLSRSLGCINHNLSLPLRSIIKKNYPKYGLLKRI